MKRASWLSMGVLVFFHHLRSRQIRWLSVSMLSPRFTTLLLFFKISMAIWSLSLTSFILCRLEWMAQGGEWLKERSRLPTTRRALHSHLSVNVEPPFHLDHAYLLISGVFSKTALARSSQEYLYQYVLLYNANIKDISSQNAFSSYSFLTKLYKLKV